MPPWQIQLKLFIQADWMSSPPETSEQMDYASDESPGGPDNLSSMVKMTYQRLKLLPFKPAQRHPGFFP